LGYWLNAPRPKQSIHEGSNAPIAGHPAAIHGVIGPATAAAGSRSLKFVETIHA